MTKTFISLCICSVSLGLCSNQGVGRFLKREASLLSERMNEGLAADSEPAIRDERSKAFMSFVDNICESDLSEFQKYSVAYAVGSAPGDDLLQMFHEGSFDDFFPNFGLSLLSSTGVNLMESRGIVSLPFQTVLLRLFSIAAKLGLSSGEIQILLRIRVEILNEKLERVSDLLVRYDENLLPRERSLQAALFPNFRGNPSLARLSRVIQDAPPKVTRSRFEEDVSFSYATYPDWEYHRTEVITLATDVLQPEIIKNEVITKIFEALSDIVEVIPFVNEFNEDAFGVLANAFSETFEAIQTRNVREIDTVRASLESDVYPRIVEAASKNEFYGLMNEASSELPVEARISFLPKLSTFLKQAAMEKRNDPNQVSFIPWRTSKTTSRLQKLALVTAIVRACIAIWNAPETKSLVGLSDLVAQFNLGIDGILADDVDVFESSALEISFEFMSRFGFNMLKGNPQILAGREWSSLERQKTVREIIVSFRIFGPSEWQKLFMGIQRSSSDGADLFITHLRKVPLDRLIEARKFLYKVLSRQRMLHKRDVFEDAPLLSPAEWLKLFLGQWTDKFILAPSRYSEWELNLEPPVLSGDKEIRPLPSLRVPEARRYNRGFFPAWHGHARIGPALQANPSLRTDSRLTDYIASFLFDHSQPKELVDLSKEISEIYLTDWFGITKGMYGFLARAVLNACLDLPRAILQVQVELGIHEAAKYAQYRNVMLESARSMFEVLRVIARATAVEWANIRQTQKCARNLALVIDHMGTAGAAIALKNHSFKWTGHASFEKKVELLITITDDLHSLEAFIDSGFIADTDLCSIPVLPKSWLFRPLEFPVLYS